MHGFPQKALNGLAHALFFALAHKKLFHERLVNWNYLVTETQLRQVLRLFLGQIKATRVLLVENAFLIPDLDFVVVPHSVINNCQVHAHICFINLRDVAQDLLVESFHRSLITGLLDKL
jgi:capsule polysaccharide modification protein KpsS